MWYLVWIAVSRESSKFRTHFVFLGKAQVHMYLSVCAPSPPSILVDVIYGFGFWWA